MSSRHHIDDFMRGRIIGKIEEGRKITDVAREFDIAHSVVSRLWKSFKTTGMCSRRHGGGRVRSTTPAEDIYRPISKKEQAHHSSAGGGLYARRPVVCVPLTRQDHTARLQWCREHHNWTEQDWACVLFSDESRFSLSSDCRRQLIWRENGTAYRPENIQEKDPYPTCSIMVWAGIIINGRTRLHVVANGTMTGQRYIDEVLLPHVRLFRGAVGDKFVFMDDNATCHRTLTVQDCLDSEGIQRLVWPARSPDLNSIEIVWDALGRQVAGRNYPPTNKNTLIRALTKEWDKLPQQLLDNVVQSMLKVEEKQFETLNKETTTHIGIREAEDWFRPIDLAKEVNKDGLQCSDESLSPGSETEEKREIVFERTSELYRGKYRCVQPKINLLKRRSYACETQCFPVEPSGCRRGAFAMMEKPSSSEKL
ncbi:transposable element Tcb2 transposase [Trichonephila clavipes]|nr:transposable element Tcb2 transposase [Trichonephila clavipes]